MDKKQICDTLARADYLASLKSGELEYFNLLFQRLIERDYESVNQIARAESLELRAVYEMLEEKTVRKLQGTTVLRCYEFSLLIDMFSGQGRGCGVEVADKDARRIEEEKLCKIFLELTGLRFGDKQSEKIKYYINLWGLRNIHIYLFDKGLRSYFNERYKELTGGVESDLDLMEIIKKVPVAQIMEEEKLLEDFVFDEVGGTYQDGLKEDLIREKASRDRAQKMLDELYRLLDHPTLDYFAVIELMKKLHMDRRIKLIESSGAQYLRNHLKSGAIDGAEAAARRFNFALPELLDRSDLEQSLTTINASLLSQCRNSEKGRHFLRWEAILDNGLIVERANCYILHGGYLMIVISPIENQEHFLFAHCPLAGDRNQLIASFLREYLDREKIASAARIVMARMLELMSGQVRLRNAARIATYAFPVVLTVAVLVGWVYKLTMGGFGASMGIGAAIMLIGEAVAARNGYGMEVKATDCETVPEYACRDHGVLKLRAPVGGKQANDGKNPK